MIPITLGTEKAQYSVIKLNLRIKLNCMIKQPYDKAANMSEQYNGLQAQFKQIAPDSLFRDDHVSALNLITGDITKCCIKAQKMFELLQNLNKLICELIFYINNIVYIKYENFKN